jgi:G6PDH family F420-dependent oxidoreductase
MAAFGYTLSSEEHGPRALVEHAVAAERAGFDFAVISDHFHPWIDRQGQSPFAWGVLGAISEATEELALATGVTCPTTRIHPAIVAQAAATAALQLPGRFSLGVGSGENLNEHVLGDAWPEHSMRAAMLEEAVALIRRLWTGELVDHDGDFYRVSRARLYTLPDEPPPILIAAGGEESAKLAGRIGDGLISTAPDKKVLKAYGKNGPKLGQVTVSWAKDERAARRTALEWWPTAAIPGDNSTELPLPSSFEALAELVTEDAIAEQVACGPDPQLYVDRIQPYLDAGFDHVYLHQVGPDQEGFLRFAEAELLPRLRGSRTKARKAA